MRTENLTMRRNRNPQQTAIRQNIGLSGVVRHADEPIVALPRIGFFGVDGSSVAPRLWFLVETLCLFTLAGLLQ